MTAEHVDWHHRVLTYQRKKLEVGSPPARLGVGVQLETLLRALPATGLLFPGIARLSSSDRAAEFRRRCRLLGITGISLHSFRYGFAERAFEAGLSERFAQAALGHSSKAVHRHYAKGAATVCPPLEDPVPSDPTPAPPNVIPFPGLPAPGVAAPGKWGAA